MTQNLLDQQAPMLSPAPTPATDGTPQSEPVGPYFPAVFDSSMLSAWKTCPALFNLSYLQHWKSKGESVHLVAGKAFAKGLEVARKAFFAQTTIEPHRLPDNTIAWRETALGPCSAEDAIAYGLQALIAEYGDFECPDDSAKSLQRMCGAFEFYFENYPLAHSQGEMEPWTMPGGKRAIEYSFAHPLPISHPITDDPILFCGRMDAILNHAGQPMICDEKTTSQLGATWSRQWDLRGQFTGYAWGCREAGIPVQGSVIRGVSILKTKYETQQAIIFSPDWQIDRWYDETCDWIREIVTAWKLQQLTNCSVAFKHNLGDACSSYGGCGFRLVCSSQDEKPWLDTYFERREWNPLLRTETLR